MCQLVDIGDSSPIREFIESVENNLKSAENDFEYQKIRARGMVSARTLHLPEINEIEDAIPADLTEFQRLHPESIFRDGWKN